MEGNCSYLQESRDDCSAVCPAGPTGPTGVTGACIL